MITYRKSRKLNLHRTVAPEIPFGARTVVAPYSSPRAAPVFVDHLQLEATGVPDALVDVADDIVDLLEREDLHNTLTGPVMVEATGLAESVFRRGQVASEFLHARALDTSVLISTEGRVPAGHEGARQVLTISTWPLDLDALRPLFRNAHESEWHWGAFVPVIFPQTTSMPNLEELADLVADNGGSFLAAVSIDLDPTAKSSIAGELFADEDEESYDVLFHSDLDLIGVATERHIAALAMERQLGEFVQLPGDGEKSNWNAAVLLTHAGSRLIRMKSDAELGWMLLRSAKTVAQLSKPLTVIAAAASLSIIESLEEIVVDALTEWLDCGRAAFFEDVHQNWRLRRDYGAGQPSGDY
ncbi:MAG: hypothetical protein ABI718_16095 [Acidobacteriota bacterium]